VCVGPCVLLRGRAEFLAAGSVQVEAMRRIRNFPSESPELAREERKEREKQRGRESDGNSDGGGLKHENKVAGGKEINAICCISGRSSAA
jgi:hypothetical protein